MSGEISVPVYDPWPELKVRWKAHEHEQLRAATNDPMAQTLAGLLPRCTGVVTPGMIIDRLDEYINLNYPDVPSKYYIEVLMGAADIFIQREAELNAEA